MTTDADTETRAVVWARRVASCGVIGLAAVLYVLLLPALLLLAALADLVRGGPWVVVRCVAFAGVYLAAELLGVLASAGLWLARGAVHDPTGARYRRWNLALQTRWGTTLYRAAGRVFAMRTVVEGDAAVARGPFLLFIRHVSVADALLPVACITARHGVALRYVLKRELLWDPCLDVVGHRLPNAFVRRGAGQGDREVARIQALLTGLGPDDGVLIYPEGTRCTEAKRARVLERLATRADPDTVDRAHRLRHVLPPHLGGPLGLLEANEAADVVFCAHSGLEGAGSILELLAGTLVGATIRVAFWRVPCREIPRGREERVRWLYDQWQRVDDWVDTLGAPPEPAALRSVG